MAINYGAKNELLTAKKVKNKINMKNFEKNLYTSNMPHPDILIRTGGQKRLVTYVMA